MLRLLHLLFSPSFQLLDVMVTSLCPSLSIKTSSPLLSDFSFLPNSNIIYVLLIAKKIIDPHYSSNSHIILLAQMMRTFEDSLPHASHLHLTNVPDHIALRIHLRTPRKHHLLLSEHLLREIQKPVLFSWELWQTVNYQKLARFSLDLRATCRKGIVDQVDCWIKWPYRSCPPLEF